MLQLLKRIKSEWILFCLVIALGIFVRSYHFSDWLHFEIDQSYDTRLVSPGVENGISSLPLLGPTAGGGRTLRLGPAFYYLEYLSAKVFGNTPSGHAGIVLVLSLLSLPLFYLLCRRYFSRYLALSLLAIFSVSLYMVLYSRFSWSPNVLPFFMMLIMYALLRSVSFDEKRREVWFLTAVAAVAIITQIHFNAFFIVPPVVAIFLMIKRPRFGWQTWLSAVAIVLVVYAPVIISDIKMNGQNTMYFVERLEFGGQHNTKALEKLVQITQYHAADYFLIDTGIDKINGKKLIGYGWQPRGILPWRLIALALLFGELYVLTSNIRKEKDTHRKDFLIFCGLLFSLSFLYFFSLAKSGFNIYPRFFLLVSPLAIILLGLMLETLHPERNRKRLAVFAAVIALLVTSNLYKINTYFSQLSHTQEQPSKVMTEDVLPNTARATLSEQLAVVDFIQSKQEENGFPVYINAKHEYEPVFWYHLERRGIAFHESIKNDVAYREANYFLITFADKGLKSYASRFTIADKKTCGVFSVYMLRPNTESITAERQTSVGETPIQTLQINELFTWNKLRSSWNAATDAAIEAKIQQAETTDIQNDVTQGLSSSDENTNGDGSGSPDTPIGAVDDLE